MQIEEGYPYSFDSSKCASCGGRCCTGDSGYIWVDEAEIASIASFLQIDAEELRQRYLFFAKGRYSIREKEFESGYACIFFDTDAKNCSIYEVRPLQCKTFPFWDYYKNNIDEALKECPALELL